MKLKFCDELENFDEILKLLAFPWQGFPALPIPATMSIVFLKKNVAIKMCPNLQIYFYFSDWLVRQDW